jgi:hypothetical protein
MRFKKFTALDAQPFHDLMPLLSLPVCFWISLVLNLATQAGVFESLFDCMFSDFERQCAVREVFVTGFLMESL